MSVPRFVGLDLGTSGIRAVEARWHRDHYQIRRAAEVDLPEGCLLNGVILDTDSVVKALRHLWRRGRFSTRKVAFAVTDTSVITRQLELPWMPAEDFRTALKYQVGDALPVDLSTVEVDFEPIAEFQVTDQHGQVNDMLQFLLVAANKEILSSVAEVLLRARLEPIVADTSAFALIRAACAGVLAQDRPLEAIVDRIRAVSAEDVLDLAREMYAPDGLSLAAVAEDVDLVRAAADAAGLLPPAHVPA